MATRGKVAVHAPASPVLEPAAHVAALEASMSGQSLGSLDQSTTRVTGPIPPLRHAAHILRGQHEVEVLFYHATATNIHLSGDDRPVPTPLLPQRWHLRRVTIDRGAKQT